MRISTQVINISFVSLIVLILLANFRIQTGPDLLVSRNNHTSHKTLNEQLFKYLSLIIYCENITTRNQLDNTGLTMLIINNLRELFELASNESVVLDLFSTIHRNASASSLFIHSISSNWSSIIGTNLLESGLDYFQ